MPGTSFAPADAREGEASLEVKTSTRNPGTTSTRGLAFQMVSA
ncbi:MAG TPA: hypothetical protein VH044_03735 [Polyangiaceae bacterium]|nr:hypothetical protein [Polyangiaceae bacterium]